MQTHKTRRLTRFERVKLILGLSGYTQIDNNTFSKTMRSKEKICRIVGHILEVSIISKTGGVLEIQRIPDQVILRG